MCCVAFAMLVSTRVPRYGGARFPILKSQSVRQYRPAPVFSFKYLTFSLLSFLVFECFLEVVDVPRIPRGQLRGMHVVNARDNSLGKQIRGSKVGRIFHFHTYCSLKLASLFGLRHTGDCQDRAGVVLPTR